MPPHRLLCEDGQHGAIHQGRDEDVMRVERMGGHWGYLPDLEAGLSGLLSLHLLLRLLHHTKPLGIAKPRLGAPLRATKRSRVIKSPWKENLARIFGCCLKMPRGSARVSYRLLS